MQLFWGEGLGETWRLWSSGTMTKCPLVLTAFQTRASSLISLSSSLSGTRESILFFAYLWFHILRLIFPPSSTLSLFSLSWERARQSKGQIALIPGRLWWSFQGCQIINTSFSYFKSLKSVDYAWGPTVLWHHLFLEVQDVILWLLTKVRGDKHPAKLPQIHTFSPYY